MGAKCSKKAEPPSAAYEQRYDQELARLQAERKAKKWAKYCCPCCCNCCCSSCDKRNATKVAIEQTETAARAKEAIQKSLGKKRLSAVAAFTKNPGVRDEAALEEQRRLEAKNKFISHGRKGKVTNGLHIEFSADFKPQQFAHVARYNATRGCMQMFLRSRVTQRVKIGDATIDFAADELVHTEDSYKYQPQEFVHIAEQAGFAQTALWQDDDAWYSLFLLHT